MFVYSISCGTNNAKMIDPSGLTTHKSEVAILLRFVVHQAASVGFATFTNATALQCGVSFVTFTRRWFDRWPQSSILLDTVYYISIVSHYFCLCHRLHMHVRYVFKISIIKAPQMATFKGHVINSIQFI